MRIEKRNKPAIEQMIAIMTDEDVTASLVPFWLHLSQKLF